MTRLRFTIAQFMAGVIFIGLGFAALRSATLLWASVVFTITVAVLSAAILGAMGRRGRTRMTWAGFAVFGWIYLATAFGPWASGNGLAAPPYLTRWPLDYWDARLSALSSRTANAPVPILWMDTGPPGEILVRKIRAAVAFRNSIPCGPPRRTPVPPNRPLPRGDRGRPGRRDLRPIHRHRGRPAQSLTVAK